MLNYKKHFFAFVLAILVGLIMLAPQLIFIAKIGDNYQGIYMMESDAETHYLARIKEFVDGNGPASPYIYEAKSIQPSTLFTYSEGILAMPSIIFGISVANMNLVYKFFLPLLISLLVYGLFIRLGFNKKYAIAGTTMIMLGHALMYGPSLLAFLKLEPIYQQFSLYARPVNPELSSIFFFVYLHILFSALKHKNWKQFIFLGILFGTTFYIYFYLYTFLIALNTSIILILLLSKQKSQALKITASTVLGILIGVPVLNSLLQLQNHNYADFLNQYLSVHNSQAPLIGITHLILYLVFLIYFFRSKKDTKLYFLLALFTSTFVATNQQILTGRVMHLGHYLWYYTTPIFIIILLFLAKNFLNTKKGWLNNIFIFAFIAIPLSNSIFYQYSSYIFWEKTFEERQAYGPILNWINQNTKPESVILAHEEISDLIPVFTSGNIAWGSHHYALVYLMPEELRSLTPEIILYKKLETGYRLDYIVWDKEKNPNWIIQNTTTLLYQDPRFDIYRVH